MIFNIFMYIVMQLLETDRLRKFGEEHMFGSIYRAQSLLSLAAAHTVCIPVCRIYMHELVAGCVEGGGMGLW